MQSVKFLNVAKSDFYPTLKGRIEQHFAQANLPRHGGRPMLLKGLLMLLLLLVPYALILTDWFSVPAMIGLFGLMGLGTAGVGMAVMHDANHGSFSDKGWVNELFSSTLYLLGGNVVNWRRQHNVQHHTYTNIHHADEDITGKPLLRLCASDRRKPIHRYQYAYAFLLYGLMTFSFFAKDFRQLAQLNRTGRHRHRPFLRTRDGQVLILSKLLYFIFIGVIPIVMTSLTFGWWLVGFLVLHFTAGLLLSVVFQLAHIVEGVTDPVQNAQGNVENAWAIHQLHTTSNFGCPRLVSWFIGGLDYQIEHHLFPGISHVHYPAIAPIVQATAAQYGLPYHRQPSVRRAIGSHVRVLRQLGQPAT